MICSYGALHWVGLLQQNPQQTKKAGNMEGQHVSCPDFCSQFKPFNQTLAGQHPVLHVDPADVTTSLLPTVTFALCWCQIVSGVVSCTPSHMCSYTHNINPLPSGTHSNQTCRPFNLHLSFYVRCICDLVLRRLITRHLNAQLYAGWSSVMLAPFTSFSL